MWPVDLERSATLLGNHTLNGFKPLNAYRPCTSSHDRRVERGPGRQPTDTVRRHPPVMVSWPNTLFPGNRFDAFAAVDLRVALIVKAEAVEGADSCAPDPGHR